MTLAQHHINTSSLGISPTLPVAPRDNSVYQWLLIYDNLTLILNVGSDYNKSGYICIMLMKMIAQDYPALNCTCWPGPGLHIGPVVFSYFCF